MHNNIMYIPIAVAITAVMMLSKHINVCILPEYYQQVAI